jgi:hypothetical protein
MTSLLPHGYRGYASLTASTWGTRIFLVERRDTQQERLLERLRAAHGEPVTFADLHAGGIDFPAAVVTELELSGYVIERVHRDGRLVGVRLIEDRAPALVLPGRSHRRWPRLVRHVGA